MTKDTHAGLLERFIRSQDAEAFALITRQYAGLVYGTCVRITGNEERAADVTQETFFHLAKHARQVTGSLAGWLHHVAVGKSVNLVRSDVARRRREEDYAAQPRETDEWSEISPLVDEALQELDEEPREILVRHYLQGETLTGIAAAKGMSQPTMSRRAEHALEELRERLRDKGVLVVGFVLGGLMTNSVSSAPAAVLAELGKMALVTTGAGAAGTTTATVLGLNAKLAVAAAVAVVGVGGYVAFRATQPAATTPPAGTAPLMATATAETSEPAATTAGGQSAPATARMLGATGQTPMVSTQPAPMGGAAVAQDLGGGATQRGGGSEGSMTMGGAMGFGGGMGFGGVMAGPPPTRATTDGALTLFVSALSAMARGRGALAPLEECFAGAAEREAFRRVWENPANDAEGELQQVLRSVGPPIEVVSTTATEDGLKVQWKATVRQPFTTKEDGTTKTWQQGDRYELEVRLKEIGGEWKIVGF